jgi:hypothetical protein
MIEDIDLIDEIEIEDAPEVFPLATAEQQQLVACEEIIRRGIATFIEVGEALSLIQKGKLYREHYSTFEDYCFDTWGIGRARAYQLISSSKVAAELSTVVDKPPKNEREAREIAKSAPEDRPKVLDRATEIAGEGPRTAKHIQQAAAELSAPEAETPDLPIEFAMAQRRFAAHGVALSTHVNGSTLAFVTKKEGMTGIVTQKWGDVVDRLARLEAAADSAPAATSISARSYDDKEAADGVRLTAARSLIAAGDIDAARDQLERIEVATYARDQVLASITPATTAQDAARAFLAEQRDRLTRFSASAMVSQTTFKQALDHIQALLGATA